MPNLLIAEAAESNCNFREALVPPVNYPMFDLDMHKKSRFRVHVVLDVCIKSRFRVHVYTSAPTLQKFTLSLYRSPVYGRRHFALLSLHSSLRLT
jgi:hypothetical protein